MMATIFFDDVMLFDLAADPHEENNLAAEHPDVVAQGMALLEDWLVEMMPNAARGRDPLANVVSEGAFHVRGELPAYLERLRATGRDVRPVRWRESTKDLEGALESAAPSGRPHTWYAP
jgi:hypothetical protein